jgi:hypothetical protein
MMSLESTTYVGFHGGIWTPSLRSEYDAVATLKYGDKDLVWDLPSRRVENRIKGSSLHPSVLDETIFTWFFGTLMQTRHVFGIDTPFGWPRGFTSFMGGVNPDPLPDVEDESNNPVLYREADRFAEKLLGVWPETMLNDGDRLTKMQTVVRILQQRVDAHVAFVGRASSGTWCRLNTIVVETDPYLATFDPRFKQRRRELLARINMELAFDGKPRLRRSEKSALTSALITLELDQAICNPTPSRTVYLIPDGMLPVGDKMSDNQEYDCQDGPQLVANDLDRKSDWRNELDHDLLPFEGFPAYPILKKHLDRLGKKSRRNRGK